MSTKTKVPAKKNKVVSSVKNAVKDVLKKEKAKVEELKVISQKAESTVAELKKASGKAKAKVKSKVAEIKKSVVRSVAEKREVSKKAEVAKAEPKTVKTAKKTPVAEKAPVVEKEKPATKEKAAPRTKKPAPKKEAPRSETTETIDFNPEYLVLMQRDPNFLHAFWDVKSERLENALAGKKSLVLRLYDVSSDLTVRKNKKRKFRDIEVPADAKSWYVQNRETVSVEATLGTKTPDGKFEPLVEAPAMQVFNYESVKRSDLKTDSAFFKASLGGAGLGGFGSSGLSSQSVARWLERLASSSESFFSGSLSSAASLSSGSLLSEASSPDSVSYGKDFFLWVKTRLIVYGGTRPDAHLQVRGEPFPLNPDGTFSFEQDLPDSTQIIPVFATDKDGDFPTTIVPVVVKRTE